MDDFEKKRRKRILNCVREREKEERIRGIDSAREEVWFWEGG